MTGCYATTSEGDLIRSLIQHGFWISTGVDGVFGRDARFESIADGVDRIIVGLAERDGAQKLFFPPIMSRETLVDSEYISSFPELCGCVSSFSGGESAHSDLVRDAQLGKPWGPHLRDTELALTPAACYPLYPTLRGTLPPDGRLIDLSSYVFRREPSGDAARLQIFRQRENVRLGSESAVTEWRSEWLDRGMGLLKALGLPVTIEVANDPFFGRGGRMLMSNQRNSRGKYEISMPFHSGSRATALASFNYHGSKFGSVFDIHTADGDIAHTACVGFGLERIALALLSVHGFDLPAWPEEVRGELGW